MKSREHIEELVNTVWQRHPTVTYEYLIVELLLDIRELMQKEKEGRER